MFPLARALAVLCLVLLPAAALAGAWPREPGGVFLSLKSEYETDSGEFRTSVYGELGLTRRITLGFEASDGPPDKAKQEEYEWQRDHGDAVLLIPPSRRRVGASSILPSGRSTPRTALPSASGLRHPRMNTA